MLKERESEEHFANKTDGQYLLLLEDILQNGSRSPDRTATGTRKVFGRQLKFNLSEGFPLLTTKSVWFKGVKEELLWFMRGERNIRTLVNKGVHIWDEWPFQRYLERNGLAEKYPKHSTGWIDQMKVFIETIKTDEEFATKWGDLGPVYGYQWRHWKTRDGKEVDQLAEAVNLIKNNPNSRRINITAWNPEDTKEVALPPCHLYFQFQVDETNNHLNTFMVQRSVDTFLGLPFNIASYALLTHIVADMTDKIPGELTMALADTHIYVNHEEQVKEQLRREPRGLPKLILNSKVTSLEDIRSEDIQIDGYNPHPVIKAPIAV